MPVVVKGVAVGDLRVDATDGEVHLCQPPSGVVRLLQSSEVSGKDRQFLRLDEQHFGPGPVCSGLQFQPVLLPRPG
jgi:hypothetical protein